MAEGSGGGIGDFFKNFFTKKDGSMDISRIGFMGGGAAVGGLLLNGILGEGPMAWIIGALGGGLISYFVKNPDKEHAEETAQAPAATPAGEKKTVAGIGGHGQEVQPAGGGLPPNLLGQKPQNKGGQQQPNNGRG